MSDDFCSQDSASAHHLLQAQLSWPRTKFSREVPDCKLRVRCSSRSVSRPSTSRTLPDTECVEDQDQTPISHISPSTAEGSAILDIISPPSSHPCSSPSAICSAVSAVHAQIPFCNWVESVDLHQHGDPTWLRYIPPPNGALVH